MVFWELGVEDSVMNSFSPCFSFFLSWDVSKCLSVWMNRQYQGFSRRPLQTGLTSWGLQAILGTQMEDRDLSVNFPPWFFLSSSGSEMVQYPGSFTLGETVVRVFHIMSFHWAHDFLASIQIPFFFFRPSICYRFYRTGLAFIHAYLLPLSPASVNVETDVPQSFQKPWLRSWVTFLQTEVLSAPHDHTHYGTEASLCGILWSFLSVMFHGLSPQPAVLGIFCLKLGFTYLTLGHLQQVASSRSPLGFV